MGLIQRSRDEGLQQGRNEGLQQGRNEGIREGLLAGIELGLELKYGPRGLQLLPEIQQIQSVELLQTIREQIKTVDNPDALRQIYHQKN